MSISNDGRRAQYPAETVWSYNFAWAAGLSLLLPTTEVELICISPGRELIVRLKNFDSREKIVKLTIVTGLSCNRVLERGQQNDYCAKIITFCSRSNRRGHLSNKLMEYTNG
jgi:hypothetical protein